MSNRHKIKQYVCENECKIKHCRHAKCILVSLGNTVAICDRCRMEEKYNICPHQSCILLEEKKLVENLCHENETREEELMKDKTLTVNNAHKSITRTIRTYGYSPKTYEYLNRRTGIKFVSEEEHPYRAWMEHLKSKRYIVSLCYYDDLVFDYLVTRDEKGVLQYKYISFSDSYYTYDISPYSDKCIYVAKRDRESDKHYKYRCIRNKWVDDRLI